MADKIGQALYIPKAICYHNNPETFGEIFSHEVWIGESLVAKGMLRTYLQKYRIYLIVFLLGVIAAIARAIDANISVRSLLLAIVCVLVLLIILVSIRRAAKENYLSHLLYVPLVMITR